MQGKSCLFQQNITYSNIKKFEQKCFDIEINSLGSSNRLTFILFTSMLIGAYFLHPICQHQKQTNAIDLLFIFAYFMFIYLHILLMYDRVKVFTQFRN